MSVSNRMSTDLHSCVWVRRSNVHQPLCHENDVMSSGEEHQKTTFRRVRKCRVHSR
ncbi:hypothetical protein L9F63_009972, partial [Diploptera punctata]